MRSFRPGTGAKRGLGSATRGAGCAGVSLFRGASAGRRGLIAGRGRAWSGVRSALRRAKRWVDSFAVDENYRLKGVCSRVFHCTLPGHSYMGTCARFSDEVPVEKGGFGVDSDST